MIIIMLPWAKFKFILFTLIINVCDIYKVYIQNLVVDSFG